MRSNVQLGQEGAHEISWSELVPANNTPISRARKWGRRISRAPNRAVLLWPVWGEVKDLSAPSFAGMVTPKTGLYKGDRPGCFDARAISLHKHSKYRESKL